MGADTHYEIPHELLRPPVSASLHYPPEEIDRAWAIFAESTKEGAGELF